MHKKEIIVSSATIMFYIAVGTTALALQVLFINKVSDFLISILPAVYWSAVLISSPFWGMLADNLSAKKAILVFTTFISGIILFLHAVFMSYTQIFLLRIAFGFFSSAFLPVSLSILLEDALSSEAGRRASLFTLSRAFGFLISGYVASLILLFFATNDLFIYGSFFVVLSVLFLMLISDKNESNDPTHNVTSIRQSFKLPGKAFITRNNGHLLVIALALRHINIMSLNALMYVYMLRKGIPDFLLGTISSFNTLVQVILMYPLGALSDKIGRKPLYLTGFTLSAIVPIAFILSSDPLSFSLSFVLIGFSFSSLISGVTPFLKDIAPEGREGEALSFLNISRSIGSIIGPVLAGVLVTIGSYEIMFETMTVITLIATVLALFTKEIKIN